MNEVSVREILFYLVTAVAPKPHNNYFIFRHLATESRHKTGRSSAQKIASPCY